VAITFLLYACADTTRVTQDSKYDQISIAPTSTAYVSVPEDGQYGTKNYSGSGSSVASIIRASLLVHLVQANVGTKFETYNQAISSAKESSADYLFFPTILHWEDRNTEWSGIPDKVQVRIVVVDLAKSEVVSAAIVDGTSGVATFGGDHPQDLLSEPISKYVDGLFK